MSPVPFFSWFPPFSPRLFFTRPARSLATQKRELRVERSFSLFRRSSPSDSDSPFVNSHCSASLHPFFFAAPSVPFVKKSEFFNNNYCCAWRYARQTVLFFPLPPFSLTRSLLRSRTPLFLLQCRVFFFSDCPSDQDISASAMRAGTSPPFFLLIFM